MIEQKRGKELETETEKKEEKQRDSEEVAEEERKNRGNLEFYVTCEL